MNFIFSKYSSKKFKKLSNENQNRIIEKLKFLKNSDSIFFYLKKLENFDPATHRLRVGDIRIILEYNENNNNFYILDIGNRGDIYK